MKKSYIICIYAFIAAAVVLIALVILKASGNIGSTDDTDYDFSNGVCFNILSIEDKTIEVGSKSPGYINGIEDYISGDITIPQNIKYNNVIYTVTSIGNRAFRDCHKLESIEIPNSVTTIGNGAFYNCSELCSIEIPNTVTKIGHSAFYGCSKLTSITLPGGITEIEAYLFRDCNSLTSIEIPNSATTIKMGAFDGCNSLTSIEIPNSVTSIGISAFYGCTALASVTCYWEEPIACEESIFSPKTYEQTLYIPKGSKDKYSKTLPWSLFSNIQEVELPMESK